MSASLKTVTRLPLTGLWDETGTNCTARGAWLDEGDVAELLRGGRVRFVIADVGRVLCWIAAGKCHAYWETEVRHRMGNPHGHFRPGEFPGGYCFLASRWDWPGDAVPVILLEKHH